MIVNRRYQTLRPPRKSDHHLGIWPHSADIALIGLAVMGQNLILNMNDHGFVVCAYNRTTQKVDDFLNNEAKDTKIVGAHSLEEMVRKLKKPRRVMMLVKGNWIRLFPLVLLRFPQRILQRIPHLANGKLFG